METLTKWIQKTTKLSPELQVNIRPFRVGDRIQIGDYAGDVIDIRIFEFTLLEIGNWVDADQSTGRIIHVPNGKVISDVLANYSRGL